MDTRPMTDIELKEAMCQRWDECKRTNGLYYRAREAAIAEAIKSFEPLKVACDEAIAAYEVLQAEFMERTKRVCDENIRRVVGRQKEDRSSLLPRLR